MYPYCSVDVPELKSIYAPLRIHSGELDNWTPAQPCEQYVAALKASNQDANIRVYAGAHHAFDDPSLPLTNLSGVVTAAKCWWRGASILDPLTLDNPSCLGRGATVGHSATAMEAVRYEVRAELARLLNGR
jgi:dienelactone hydrolase